MFATFDTFEIEMTLAQAESASQPGKDALEDVRELLKDKKIIRQLKKIGNDKIRDELKQWGGWEYEELEDDEANRERIVWLAAGNISDEQNEKRKGKGRHWFQHE